MAKLTPAEARLEIWSKLRKVAKPDSRFSWTFSEFITDYEGSEDGAMLISSMDIYKNAKVIFITPDNNLEKLREIAFKDKKTVIMTNYGITRGFFMIKPGDIPEGKEEMASLLDGVGRFWKHKTLKELKAEISKIDMMVTGSSAITLSGIRFGKGHGYFDLEWAMTYTYGLVDVNTPVIGVGHDCQVVDVEVEPSPFDTAIDWIVTPTQIIKTRHEYKKPTYGIIWELLDPNMKRDIPPIQEAWADQFCK